MEKAIKEYTYRLVRVDTPDLLFRSTNSSLGAACWDVCKAEGIEGAHRWANGYTVYIVGGGHIIGVVVRD